MSKVEDYARTLTKNLIDYHDAQIRSGDERVRNAAIIKSVALVALAFDIPPTSDDPTIDYDDCLAKLRDAIEVLQDVSDEGPLS